MSLLSHLPIDQIALSIPAECSNSQGTSKSALLANQTAQQKVSHSRTSYLPMLLVQRISIVDKHRRLPYPHEHRVVFLIEWHCEPLHISTLR